MGDTKQRILETSIDLFSQKGYNNVPVREIAAAVGIKEASLYNHFESKQAILNAIFSELEAHFQKQDVPAEQAAAMLENITLDGFIEISVQAFRAYINNARIKKIIRIILIERLINPRAAEMFYRHFIENTVTYTAAIFEKMGLPWEPRLAARMFHAHTLLVISLAVDETEGLKPSEDQIEKMVREQAFFFKKVFEKG